MRIKSGFLLHSMGEEYVVVPVEERTNEFHGLIRLNKTGAFLWEAMQEEFTPEKLAAALEENYEVSAQEAADHVKRFLEKFLNAGIVEK